ncbi:MAG: CHAT domain-containing protein [Scytonema sp. PMC 1070.18]|nr:CHAT domain-containing protein [Scytonema sp. PMC 1070.18]
MLWNCWHAEVSKLDSRFGKSELLEVWTHFLCSQHCLVLHRTVLLSACQTGVGKATNGEGVYGLRRAFVMAGAQSQLISLWSVDDLGTKELMVKYYGRLIKNEGRSQALRQTQLEMLKSQKYQHPFYWAAFIPSGDWTSAKF